jgi:hypothetical protein
VKNDILETEYKLQTCLPAEPTSLRRYFSFLLDPRPSLETIEKDTVFT